MIQIIFIGKVKIKKPKLSYNNIKKFIGLYLKNKNIGLKYLNIIFCSKYYIKKINKKYLNHNYYTDIISFEYHKDPIESDIFICSEIVEDNAKEYNEDLEKEYLRIIFHGILHLMGYKDTLKKNKLEMTKQEDLLLKKYYEKTKKKMDAKGE